jgi:threonine synthase
MKFHSTRGGPNVEIVDAIMHGLAADGGLYVPELMPTLAAREIAGESLPEIAAEVMRPFFLGSELASELDSICADALNFPVPLRRIERAASGLHVLELFHGPTAAFKDVGARFLAAVMERVEESRRSRNERPLTVLVATSGDTGSAVAAAFNERRGIRVAVLFPKGQVSPRQRQQLTCWGENILSLEVDGTFDDCQGLVKAAFTDPVVSRHFRLSAANSINLGRLLPQAAYHAAAALWHWRQHDAPLNVVVPTGNLGNGLACFWARAVGMPIADIVLAVNANQTIPAFLESGQYRPKESVRTLASAMDVGDPSNMERLRHLVPDWEQLRAQTRSISVSDAEIRTQIARDFERYGEIWCPHTATGFHAFDQLPTESKVSQSWSVCATAHPAKFESIVEPIIGQAIPIPAALAEILAKPSRSTLMPARLDALQQNLLNW